MDYHYIYLCSSILLYHLFKEFQQPQKLRKQFFEGIFEALTNLNNTNGLTL